MSWCVAASADIRIVPDGERDRTADVMSAVVFRGNTVRNMSPRGSLFATPEKIVCESNLFSSVGGAAILTTPESPVEMP